MKNSIYVLSLFVFATLILSSTPVQEVARFAMTVVGDEPILPDTPYSYNEVNIPEHLLASAADPGNGNDPGYGAGGIDTTVFPLINNDIATLGRVLFYDVNLSSTQDISCGSCHKQELSFAEEVTHSQGTNMATMRNSMHLNDLGWSNTEGFSWDLSHATLEEILEVPFQDVNELGIEPTELLAKLNESTFYPALFEKAFGNQAIRISFVIEALADFIKSMNTFNSKLDQAAQNDFVNFNPDEMLGMELFGENCSGCHFQGESPILPSGFPTLFLLPQIFNNGLTIENGDIGAGSWNTDFQGLFKLPTLRNIELTAPYMHDGRFETLDEVIDHYSEGIVENQWTNFFSNPLLSTRLESRNFSNNEKASLKAFLLTLTDESFLTNPKWSDPFENIQVNNNNIKNIESVVLKPNPMFESATISFENAGNELVEITIHSNDGRLLTDAQTRGNEYLIRKNNFIPGIYVVKLVMGSRQSSRKLVVH